ncbi:MAG: hypothetical protein M1832_005629 [Thelocarpon impressellum]|nr:MAG: hypothetical protein M1832_005629 [Thelocarpon impressellum]
MAPTPVTIVTGFLGSGKTTLILSLLPQLPPSYRLALLKNEFGDVAIDSTLASSGSISGVRELLNGCICCNLVGQLGEALQTLKDDVAPDRIMIETSGSAFPATLAMEVNRLANETGGGYVLDGVVTVIDVENWKGYDDTSYTARLQARYTDLVVFNKWEDAGERRFDECLDRLGDLEVDVVWVKSDKGRVGKDVILGIDSGLARELSETGDNHEHQHDGNHSSEVEVLSVTLPAPSAEASVDMTKLTAFLETAPKDEVYRIKGIVKTGQPMTYPDMPKTSESDSFGPRRSILNWAFGRYTFTPIDAAAPSHCQDDLPLRMTLILAQSSASKWQKKIEAGGLLVLDGAGDGVVSVRRMMSPTVERG